MPVFIDRGDQIRPRWEHMARGLPFYSPAEERGGSEEYAYSSVMDYTGWNEDAHGLGHYDRAFVMHGYVNMVEAFRTVENEAGGAVSRGGRWGRPCGRRGRRSRRWGG